MILEFWAWEPAGAQQGPPSNTVASSVDGGPDGVDESLTRDLAIIVIRWWRRSPHEQVMWPGMWLRLPVVVHLKERTCWLGVKGESRGGLKDLQDVVEIYVPVCVFAMLGMAAGYTSGLGGCGVGWGVAGHACKPHKQTGREEPVQKKRSHSSRNSQAILEVWRRV